MQVRAAEETAQQEEAGARQLGGTPVQGSEGRTTNRITAAAGGLMQQVQDSLAAAVLRLALQCSVCLLLVLALLLGDAALVAFLHAGSPNYPIEEAFGITVGVNLGVAVAIMTYLVVRGQIAQRRAATGRATAAAGAPQPLEGLMAAMCEALAGVKAGGGLGGGLGGGTQDVEGLGSGDGAAGGASGGAGAGGGTRQPAPIVRRLVSVWATVGKVIGAIPHDQDGEWPPPGQQPPGGQPRAGASLVSVPSSLDNEAGERYEAAERRSGQAARSSEAGGGDGGAAQRARSIRLAGHPVAPPHSPQERLQEAYPQ